jgi:hypothetical protein
LRNHDGPTRTCRIAPTAPKQVRLLAQPSAADAYPLLCQLQAVCLAVSVRAACLAFAAGALPRCCANPCTRACVLLQADGLTFPIDIAVPSAASGDDAPGDALPVSDRQSQGSPSDGTSSTVLVVLQTVYAIAMSVCHALTSADQASAQCSEWCALKQRTC